MIRHHLAARGVTSPAVLQAMREIPRERFVSPSCREEAYADRALPIECGQTISQPYIVGLMTQALAPEPGHRVLEIGTGTGYQTAILARLCAEVITIERFPALAFQAAERLRDLGIWNAFFLCGDGTLGWPHGVPYDRILVTAAASHVPEPLWEQLAEGGILVIPVGDRERQTLEVVRKVDGRPCWYPMIPCRFVPLVGQHGWNEE